MLQNLQVNLTSSASNPNRDGALEPNRRIGETGFSAVAADINSSQGLPSVGTELAALVQEVVTKTGDNLPLEASESAAEEQVVASGEALLAFLMANAGNSENSVEQDALSKIEQALMSQLSLDDVDDVSSEDAIAELVNSLVDLVDLVKPIDETTGNESQDIALDAEALVAPLLQNESNSNEVDDEIAPIAVEDAKLNVDKLGEGDQITPPVVLSFSAQEPNVDGKSFKLQPLADGVALSAAHPLSQLAVAEDNDVETNAENLLGLTSEEEVSKVVQLSLTGEPISGQIIPGKAISDADSRPPLIASLDGDASEDGFGLAEKAAIKGGSEKEAEKPVVASLNTSADTTQKPTVDVKLTQTAIENKELDASVDDVDTVADKFSKPLLEQTQTVFQRAVTKPSAELQLVAQQNIFDRPMKMAEAANALSDKIHTLIRGELKHAIIRLDPPELGALEVRVHVQNDQTQVQIISQSALVREALEQQAARLRDSLAQQGLTMANLDVSDQSAQHQAGRHGESSGGSGSGFDDGDVNETAEVIEVKTSIGLVDQYV